MICGIINMENQTPGPPAGEAPVADFIPDGGYEDAGTPIVFVDQSTHEPTSWRWTVNGVLFSNSQNPSYYFNFAGNYDVSLTASNYWGSSTVTYSFVIENPI